MDTPIVLRQRGRNRGGTDSEPREWNSQHVKREGSFRTPSRGSAQRPPGLTAAMDSKLFLDAFAWTLNVISAVVIIVVNKLLIGDQGYGFKFAATLSGLHFLASYTAMQVQKSLGYMTVTGEVPFRDVIIFVLVNDLSIVSLNMSLMINTVGFYQIAKLLNIPFVCCVERLWLKRQFPLPVTASICLVVLGVGMVTVTDVSINTLGLSIALFSVVSAGMQQILCNHLQKKYKTSSSELLLISGLPIGLSLLTVGPFFDRFQTGNWILEFPWSTTVIGLIALSSSVAIAVNFSQFMCLGRFSAVAYQVMGHVKTFLVLGGGVFFFGEHISAKQGLGMLMAIIGMSAYGYFCSKPTNTTPGKEGAEVSQEIKGLLEDQAKGDSSNQQGDMKHDTAAVSDKTILTHRVNNVMESVISTPAIGATVVQLPLRAKA